MKIIVKDNFDRESVSDRLIAENVSEHWAERIVDAMNAREHEHSPDFFKAVPDDYELYVYDPR